MVSNEKHQSSAADPLHQSTSYMAKFKLYETCSNFYLIGREKKGPLSRVLKIDRLEPAELNIHEDSTTYSEDDCDELLRRIHEGNKSTGGLKFVTDCYGIVGFVKFLGPYYMLLITERRKIGAICGHIIYAITKSKMIPIPNSTLLSDMAHNKNENRYRRLICNVDLTKDFFFSYSYRVMFSLQKNACDNRVGRSIYETMFVWNEFLTRAIRNRLKNTLWTVALVYGFFKQAKFSLCGKDFILTLIARRSRHFAGTRYLKRGVNEKGRVANDVETEQIVFMDMPEENKKQVSSVVQNRGSIPLFWSQEASLLNIKPDIILAKKDFDYTATRLHFENLAMRYGSPIIILNLVKSHEKKPRESLLRVEFANAIDVINKDLTDGNRLMFLHWDFHQQTRKKATNILLLLGKVAEYALNLTGIFYCQLATSTNPVTLSSETDFMYPHYALGGSPAINIENVNSGGGIFDSVKINGNSAIRYLVKPSTLQNGVLRTNCIDCLDRTNVAQYAYGLVALGRQLCASGVIQEQDINIDTPLASDLMRVYEMMGDTLALQYGGSPAHNKVFSERRGQCRAATQSQELFRTLRRHYNNAYMDAEKQDAINLFLGHFQPQAGKPALWELNSDHHYDIGRRCPSSSNKNARPSFRRSLSDGNVLCDGNAPATPLNISNQNEPDQVLSERPQGQKQAFSESTPEISITESDISYSRHSTSTSRDLLQGQHLGSDLSSLSELDAWNCSNFLDVDLLSSSGNSCVDYANEGVVLDDALVANLPCETSNMGREELPNRVGYLGMPSDFSHNFVDWVNNGGLLSY